MLAAAVMHAFGGAITLSMIYEMRFQELVDWWGEARFILELGGSE